MQGAVKSFTNQTRNFVYKLNRMFLSLAASSTNKTGQFLAPILSGISTVQSDVQAETNARQAADDAITNVMSTDTERLAQATNLISQFQGADSDVTSALTGLISNEQAARIADVQNLQAEINANDSELANMAGTVSSNTNAIVQAQSGVNTNNSRLGGLTSINLGTLSGQTVALSTQFAGRQVAHTSLDSVIASGRTETQLNSLDTTSSIATQLTAKADASTTYSKIQVDGLVQER